MIESIFLYEVICPNGTHCQKRNISAKERVKLFINKDYSECVEGIEEKIKISFIFFDLFKN